MLFYHFPVWFDEGVSLYICAIIYVQMQYYKYNKLYQQQAQTLLLMTTPQ